MHVFDNLFFNVDEGYRFDARMRTFTKAIDAPHVAYFPYIFCVLVSLSFVCPGGWFSSSFHYFSNEAQDSGEQRRGRRRGDAGRGGFRFRDERNQYLHGQGGEAPDAGRRQLSAGYYEVRGHSTFCQQRPIHLGRGQGDIGRSSLQYSFLLKGFKIPW